MGHTDVSPHTRPAPAAPRRPACAEAVALLSMAQAGHRDAFAQLYHRYQPAVRRYITARTPHWDRDAVPDLVQDTFCVALEELHHAHHDVVGWLIQLAAKMCTRHDWSQRRYRRAALTTGEHQRRHTTAADQPPLPAATRTAIAQALARLDPHERLVLHLRFFDGQHHATAARIIGCSLWTVKQRQRRALRHLADRLGAEPHTPARTVTRR